MYEDALLSLSRDQRFRHSEPLTDPVSEVRNPACGDEVALYADLSGDRIQHLRFYAQGCAVCIASAAAMCEELNGCTVPEGIQRIDAALRFFGGQEEWLESWGTPSLPALGAVRARPMRMSCVRMAWEGIRKAL
jgi:nitrogen fixation NifU-like protein